MYYEIVLSGTDISIEKIPGDCPATPEWRECIEFKTFTEARSVALALLARGKWDYTQAYQRMKKMRKCDVQFFYAYNAFDNELEDEDE